MSATSDNNSPAPIVNKKKTVITQTNNNINNNNMGTTTDDIEAKKQKLESQIEVLGKFASRIHVDQYVPSAMSPSVASDIKLGSKKAGGDK